MNPTKRRRRTLKAIDAVHAALPTLACKGSCHESCGPIGMTKPEWERIIERLGHEPRGDASLVCPMLGRATGRCRVYEERPTICRLWGLVRSMACPLGCVPSRWLSEREGHELLDRVARIAAGEDEHDG
jgi:uncharacterized protein